MLVKENLGTKEIYEAIDKLQQPNETIEYEARVGRAFLKMFNAGYANAKFTPEQMISWAEKGEWFNEEKINIVWDQVN